MIFGLVGNLLDLIFDLSQNVLVRVISKIEFSHGETGTKSAGDGQGAN